MTNKNVIKIAISGGNGFIGHHFCEHILKNTDWNIDILDRLSYSSFGYDRLKDVNVYDDKRVRHFCHDLTKPIEGYLQQELLHADYIVHMGAETHVDRSIKDPEPFVMSNVVGTMHLLNFARQCRRLKKMIYFSTDEVFGPAKKSLYPNGFKEWDRYKSSNPYAATKAGGEELCIAYENTYGVPVAISHAMNVFGERQHPEKFIPMVIRKVLNGEKIIIHADRECKIPGSRFWIHARNVAEAVMFLLETSVSGDKYNIVGEEEVDNLQMAQFIAEVLGRKLNYELVDFHSSRPGHDLRYALDGAKLKKMGFEYPKNFRESLVKTVEWTLQHPEWLDIQKEI